MQSSDLPFHLILVSALLVRFTEENCGGGVNDILLKADQLWRELSAYEPVI